MPRKATQTAQDLLNVKRMSLENMYSKLESQRQHIEVMKKAVEKSESEIEYIKEFVEFVENRQQELDALWQELSDMQPEYQKYIEWIGQSGKFNYETAKEDKKNTPEMDEEYDHYISLATEYERKREQYYDSREKLNTEARAKFYMKKA